MAPIKPASKGSSERLQRSLRLTPMEPPPVSVDEDLPFLRSNHRARVRRTRRGRLGRAILALQVGGGVLVVLSALWTGYSRVMASDTLRVSRLEVRGSRFLSEGEVRELLGPAVGENILGLDIQSLKSRLRVSPWVADASVRRTLPDTLRVEIRERVPLALAELERLYLMDGDGTIIDVYGPNTSGYDLPIVRGLRGADDATRRDRAERAGALLADLGALASEISEVEVDASGELKVTLRGAGEILRLSDPPYQKAFATFVSLREELRQRCPDAEFFDLRFEDRIYAKPASRSASVAATLRAPLEKAR